MPNALGAAGFTDFYDEVLRGGTHHLRFTVKIGGVVQNTSLWPKLWVTGKRQLSDPDSSAVFLLTTDLNDGVVKVNVTFGQYAAIITPAHTLALPNREVLIYVDIQGKDDQEVLWKLARGTLISSPTVKGA